MVSNVDLKIIDSLQIRHIWTAFSEWVLIFLCLVITILDKLKIYLQQWKVKFIQSKPYSIVLSGKQSNTEIIFDYLPSVTS